MKHKPPRFRELEECKITINSIDDLINQLKQIRDKYSTGYEDVCFFYKIYNYPCFDDYCDIDIENFVVQVSYLEPIEKYNKRLEEFEKEKLREKQKLREKNKKRKLEEIETLKKLAAKYPNQLKEIMQG